MLLQPFRQDHNGAFEVGTTLIAATSDDGIVMVADDLIYAEQGGQPIPVAQGVKKVFVAASNIIVGSAGVLRHSPLEYQYEDWIAKFIKAHCSETFQRPSDIATFLGHKVRETFHRLETRPDDGIWKTHHPSEFIVSYVVGGYAESFYKPYLFELGAKVKGDHEIEYVGPIPRTGNVWFGEDKFFPRAQQGLQPERSLWQELSPVEVVREILPNTPTALQELTASVIGLIQVEAKFNPKKVGTGFSGGLIDRRTKTVYVL